MHSSGRGLTLLLLTTQLTCPFMPENTFLSVVHTKLNKTTALHYIWFCRCCTLTSVCRALQRKISLRAPMLPPLLRWPRGQRTRRRTWMQRTQKSLTRVKSLFLITWLGHTVEGCTETLELATPDQQHGCLTTL